MYVINNMDFYVKISDAVGDDDENTAKKVEYVTVKNATRYKTMSEAAEAAEDMAISGFTVEKYKKQR
jgi:hypothetical protein